MQNFLVLSNGRLMPSRCVMVNPNFYPPPPNLTCISHSPGLTPLALHCQMALSTSKPQKNCGKHPRQPQWCYWTQYKNNLKKTEDEMRPSWMEVKRLLHLQKHIHSTYWKHHHHHHHHHQSSSCLKGSSTFFLLLLKNFVYKCEKLNYQHNQKNNIFFYFLFIG